MNYRLNLCIAIFPSGLNVKILDKYILKEFIYTLVGVLFICAIVMLVYLLIENYEEILENSPGIKYVTLYFLNSLPYQMIEIVPLAVAIAVLFTVGTLARHNELVAMVAAGISTKRIAAPILIATLGFSVLTLLFNEMVVPGCQERARYIEKAFIEGKGTKIFSRSREIFVKGKGQRFYIMDAFDSTTNVMTNPTVIDENKTGSSLSMRLDADRGEFIEEKGEGRYWNFENARRWTYDENGRPVDFVRFDNLALAMEEDLEKFLSNRKKPEEMNVFELYEYINILSNRGESVSYYKTDFHLKIAFPFASFIVALICYCFAVRLESGNLVLGYALGIVAVIAFYAVTAVSQALGHHFILPPIVAGWFPNVVFAGLGFLFVHRLSL